MASDKKINAIADAEIAGLYYSSNTEPGYTRKLNEKEQVFFDVRGKPLKAKRELKRIDELFAIIAITPKDIGLQQKKPFIKPI